MDDASLWTVDRLAAGQLLVELKLEATDALLERVARHFARHRQDLMRWAAERVQANMVQALEDASRQSFARASDDWAQGFSSAEQRLLVMTPEELLGMMAERGRTKGQYLRSMIRQARGQSSA